MDAQITVRELELLAARFVGRKRIQHAFAQFSKQQQCQLVAEQQASPAMILHTEQVLASVFGKLSAKLVLTSALQGRDMQLEDVATIVDEASEIFDFSRGLLQGAINILVRASLWLITNYGWWHGINVTLSYFHFRLD